LEEKFQASRKKRREREKEEGERGEEERFEVANDVT